MRSHRFTFRVISDDGIVQHMILLVKENINLFIQLFLIIYNRIMVNMVEDGVM